MSRRKSPKPGARKCEFEFEDEPGRVCKAYALRDSDPARCRVHSWTSEEVSAQARRMANRRNLIRRSNVEPKVRSELAPDLQLGQIMAVIAPALEATDPWTSEPLWGVRLAAAGTLLAAFPRTYRETPEKINDLLEQLIPDRVLDRERMNAQAVFEALRDSWSEVKGLRWDKLVGLYVRPYPGHTIAPWEDRVKIQGLRKRPIRPDKAPVVHLPDGRVALQQEGKLLEIPAEAPEPDDMLNALPLEEPDPGDDVIKVEPAVPAW